MECESNDDGALSESRKSFPSGHSSFAFMGMTMLTLFFLGKIGFYRTCTSSSTFCAPNSPSRDMNTDMNMNMNTNFIFKRRLLTIVGTSPMLLAIYIAASRVHDDYHHPADVVAGSMIGLICSGFSYSLW